ncbi:MAG: CPBP family intramembrane glutamic endopeptidase [Acidobacteriota bacterium]
MRSLARRFPLAFYYAVALMLASAVMAAYGALLATDPDRASLLTTMFQWLARHQLYATALNIARFAWSTGSWSSLLILVFAVAPSVAACLTVMLRDGRPGIRGWAARLRPVGPDVPVAQAIRAYVVLAVVYGVGLTWHLWLTMRYASPAAFSEVWHTMGGSLPAVLALAVAGPFLDEGGLLEEMGWRGFALPLCQQRMSGLTAAIVVGLLWYAWHLPREIPTLLGRTSLPSWLAGQAVFALLTVSLSVAIAYFVNRTGGSVLPGIILHGGTNVWSKAASAQASEMFHTDMRTWITVALAVVILGAAGRGLGRPGGGARGGRGAPPGASHARNESPADGGRPGGTQASP